ncbi:MAG: hypothetical protein RL333_934, partial [Pseudomonadota bacterium]
FLGGFCLGLKFAPALFMKREVQSSSIHCSSPAGFEKKGQEGQKADDRDEDCGENE